MSDSWLLGAAGGAHSGCAGVVCRACCWRRARRRARRRRRRSRRRATTPLHAPARRPSRRPRLLLPPGAPARGIALPPPDAGESGAAQGAGESAVPTPARRQQEPPAGRGISRGRCPPRMPRCAWPSCPGSRPPTAMRAAQLTVTSPGAAALRLGLSLHDAPAGPACCASRAAAAARRPSARSARPQLGRRRTSTGRRCSRARRAPSSSRCRRTRTRALRSSACRRSPISSRPAAACARSTPSIGLAGACEVDVACLDPTLQQQLRIGDQCGRPDGGHHRRRHLPVHRHAAQRFARTRSRPIS